MNKSDPPTDISGPRPPHNYHVIRRRTRHFENEYTIEYGIQTDSRTKLARPWWFARRKRPQTQPQHHPKPQMTPKRPQTAPRIANRPK